MRTWSVTFTPNLIPMEMSELSYWPRQPLEKGCGHSVYKLPGQPSIRVRRLRSRMQFNWERSVFLVEKQPEE